MLGAVLLLATPPDETIRSAPLETRELLTRPLDSAVTETPLAIA